MVYTIRINMSLTDERVLLIIKDKLNGESGELRLQDIADAVGCGRNTAHRAIKRLKKAGKLKSDWQGFSRPCIYQVLDG